MGGDKSGLERLQDDCKALRAANARWEKLLSDEPDIGRSRSSFAAVLLRESRQDKRKIVTLESELQAAKAEVAELEAEAEKRGLLSDESRQSRHARLLRGEEEQDSWGCVKVMANDIEAEVIAVEQDRRQLLNLTLELGAAVRKILQLNREAEGKRHEIERLKDTIATGGIKRGGC